MFYRRMQQLYHLSLTKALRLLPMTLFGNVAHGYMSSIESTMSGRLCILEALVSQSRNRIEKLIIFTRRTNEKMALRYFVWV
jgi:hypothetical protein